MMPLVDWVAKSPLPARLCPFRAAIAVFRVRTAQLLEIQHCQPSQPASLPANGPLLHSPSPLLNHFNPFHTHRYPFPTPPTYPSSSVSTRKPVTDKHHRHSVRTDRPPPRRPLYPIDFLPLDLSFSFNFDSPRTDRQPPTSTINLNMPLPSLHPLPNNPTTGQAPLAGLRAGPPPASAAGGGGVSRETLKGLQDVYWSDDEVRDPSIPVIGHLKHDACHALPRPWHFQCRCMLATTVQG